MWNCEQTPQSTFMKGLSPRQIMCVRCWRANDVTALPRGSTEKLWVVVEERGLCPEFSRRAKGFQHRSNLQNAFRKTGFSDGILGDAFEGMDNR